MTSSLDLREHAQSLEDLAQAFRTLADALEGIEEILEAVKIRPKPTPCEICGTGYDACTRRILVSKRGACCGACAERDTHGMREAGVL